MPAADFTALFGRFCCLLTERPLPLTDLRACFAALDAYAAAHPGSSWPLTLTQDGVAHPLLTLEALLWRYSLDVLPPN